MADLVRIKPGKLYDQSIHGKDGHGSTTYSRKIELQRWYIVAIGQIPIGYKKAPWVSVPNSMVTILIERLTKLVL